MMAASMAPDASVASPSGSAGLAFRSIWAPRCPSKVRYGCRVTAPASTRNSPVPPSGNAALTTRVSAQSPASTGFF